MFIDICFPDNNEERFIEIAKKLGTRGLIFLYSPEKWKMRKEYLDANLIIKGAVIHNNNQVHKNFLTFCPLIPGNDIRNNIIYFYSGFGGKSKFYTPMRDINQVIIKELRDKEALLGIPFSLILERPIPEIERISFLMKLCKKYNVRVFFSSFAKDPYVLRSEKELISVAKLLGFDERLAKSSVNELSSLFTEKYSAIFL